jgi:hypothetical protein
MSNKHSKVCNFFEVTVFQILPATRANVLGLVIARNALAQEESEEFSGDFSDPINIHIENDRDGCAC